MPRENNVDAADVGPRVEMKSATAMDSKALLVVGAMNSRDAVGHPAADEQIRGPAG